MIGKGTHGVADFRYAHEKLYLAVAYAATAAGDARARIEGVWSHIHGLRAEDLPPDAWAKVSSVLNRLHSQSGMDMNAVNKLGWGIVSQNAKSMTNRTASKLLKQTWEAYESVKEAYESVKGA